ncbi:MAG: hypothetical protein HKN56_06800 [Gammaproteobacteria bacterium]|nr:hypothetical protein [Gammaproteobacteria bacterium]
MQHENTPEHPQKERDYFVPLLLVVFSLLFIAVGQLIHILQEKDNLARLKSGQEKPLQESRNVREQFDSVTTGMARLAAQGNPHAALLLEELRKQGVTINLPDNSSP